MMIPAKVPIMDPEVKIANAPARLSWGEVIGNQRL